MSAWLRIRLEGGPALINGIRAAMLSAEDMSVPLKEIAEDHRALQGAQFLRGGPPQRRWKKNRGRYARTKALRNLQVGTWTGELRRSLARQHAKGAIETITRKKLLAGTATWYAAPFNKVRPLLRVATKEVRQEWGEILSEHMAGLWPGESLSVIRGRRRRRPKKPRG